MTRAWATAGFVAVVAVVAGGCGPTVVHRVTTTTRASSTAVTPTTRPLAVSLFGDSLAAQAAPDFDRLLGAKGITVTNEVFGGTAPCDWLPAMSRTAATRPAAVVLEFSGNAFTPCMQGCSPESGSAVTKYCDDVDGAIGLFSAAGTKVFLIGTPISHAEWVNHDSHSDDLNRAFEALAAAHPRMVTFVDAGLAVEGRDGAFTWTLPCLPTEPCTGPVVAGVPSNAVRAADGAHFCVSPPDSGLGCSGYSSGAFRFARAMAEPVLKAILG